MQLKTEIICENYRFIDKVEYLAKEAFPIDEYLPPSILIQMSKNDNFKFLAIIEDNRFIGFTAIFFYQNYSYLFFLAIMPEERFKGYGSKIIEMLKSKYLNYIHVVDFEKVDINCNNYIQRQKRRNFYLKNGYKKTGLFITYLNVDYEVFTTSDEFDINIFKKLMSNINIPGFDPIYNI